MFTSNQLVEFTTKKEWNIHQKLQVGARFDYYLYFIFLPPIPAKYSQFMLNFQNLFDSWTLVAITAGMSTVLFLQLVSSPTNIQKFIPK